jgi:hypothetical protein
MGSWFYSAQSREGGAARSSATGSAGGRIVRFARRDKTSTRKLTPPKKNRGGLRGGENGDEPRLVWRHQSLHHSGSEMPSGYPVLPRTTACTNTAQACCGRAGEGRGGCRGESLARESWWVSGVLVDNKLVAEIGERHLVSAGSQSLEAQAEGVGGTSETSPSRRPITLNGGKLRRAARVFQLCSRIHLEFDQSATPCRKMGIEPIEGILG